MTSTDLNNLILWRGKPKREIVKKAWWLHHTTIISKKSLLVSIFIFYVMIISKTMWWQISGNWTEKRSLILYHYAYFSKFPLNFFTFLNRIMCILVKYSERLGNGRMKETIFCKNEHTRKWKMRFLWNQILKILNSITPETFRQMDLYGAFSQLELLLQLLPKNFNRGKVFWDHFYVQSY